MADLERDPTALWQAIARLARRNRLADAEDLATDAWLSLVGNPGPQSDPWLAAYLNLDNDPGPVFDPASSYSYKADSPDSVLRQRLVAEAGWQSVPFPSL